MRDEAVLSFARKLIANGADPEDNLTVYRDKTLCFSDRLQKFASLTVHENPHLHFAKYQAFEGIETI